ncbi:MULTISPECIES: hypothetical protein [unclassified Chryseobacterium]|uniref:hypothetical protein n=1 Tax=unclassified Chryseobacterium TaxID=2593645 RepID=UPI002269A4CC|nr:MULTISPECIES: hypothetical protein [unclassified Chryseobacterium]
MENLEKELKIDEKLINKRLSKEQLICTHDRAKEIISKIKYDFEINIESFKNFKTDYEFIHFVFVDRRFLWKLNAAINDYKHDLYYLIIVNNFERISEDSFNNCESYIVNEKQELQLLTIDFNKYQSLRKDFFKGIGNEIKYESTEKITEYITFENWMWELFAKYLEGADGKMKVKVICIQDGCAGKGIENNEIDEYFRRPENQQRLSLAFQQTQESPDENYFDIGNMQP